MGLKQPDWKLEGFYRYNTSLSQGFLEMYGEFFKKTWEVKASVSYSFEDKPSFGIATEGGIKLPFPLSSRLEFKAGMASEKFAFHSNYDVAFLLWNRFVFQEKDSQKLLLQEGSVKELVYFMPSLKMEWLKKKFHLKPSLFLSQTLTDKKMHYELDLNARYFFSRNFFASITGGLAYESKRANYGVLAQAAVTF